MYGEIRSLKLLLIWCTGLLTVGPTGTSPRTRPILESRESSRSLFIFSLLSLHPLIGSHLLEILSSPNPTPFSRVLVRFLLDVGPWKMQQQRLKQLQHQQALMQQAALLQQQSLYNPSLLAPPQVRHPSFPPSLLLSFLQLIARFGAFFFVG